MFFSSICETACGHTVIAAALRGIRSSDMRYSDADKERMLGYPILSLLSVNGKRTDRRGPLHFSPFRDEKVGSFKIDVQRNVWYDHGEGCGGSVFTLAQRLKDDLHNRPSI